MFKLLHCFLKRLTFTLLFTYVIPTAFSQSSFRSTSPIINSNTYPSTPTTSTRHTLPPWYENATNIPQRRTAVLDIDFEDDQLPDYPNGPNVSSPLQGEECIILLSFIISAILFMKQQTKRRVAKNRQ